MLIDFHTHVFPDKIAHNTIAMLKKNMSDVYGIKQDVTYWGDVAGLKASMERSGVDLSVIMPIATKPHQHTTINNFAEEITDNESIISFASLHPYQEDTDETLREIARRGFRGIKLHPDYQGVYADDERFIHIVKKAAELGLYVMIHAGRDLGVKPPNKGAAKHLRPLLGAVDTSRVILAHMGSFLEWDEAERFARETDAYFDISVVSRYIAPDRYRRIIETRGADRVLFGSDSPWEDPRETLAFLKESGVSSDELELITHKNAEMILF